jgi:hypothetical protein
MMSAAKVIPAPNSVVIHFVAPVPTALPSKIP